MCKYDLHILIRNIIKYKQNVVQFERVSNLGCVCARVQHMCVRGGVCVCMWCVCMCDMHALVTLVIIEEVHNAGSSSLVLSYFHTMHRIV